MTAPSILTPREREIFDAVLRSQSTRQIAASRGLRYQTVKNYLTTIYSKLGVANRIALCDKFGRSAIDIRPAGETVDAELRANSLSTE
jgi:DNA-binding NarL/FixJ family response regulator